MACIGQMRKRSESGHLPKVTQLINLLFPEGPSPGHLSVSGVTRHIPCVSLILPRVIHEGKRQCWLWVDSGVPGDRRAGGGPSCLPVCWCPA